MSVFTYCQLGRLYTRATRRFRRPGKQAVSAGGALYSAAQMLRDRHRRKPLVILSSAKEGEPLFRAFQENDLKWSVFVLPAPTAKKESAWTAAQLYRTERCDCIVALGGAAVMNTAKTAAAYTERPSLARKDKYHHRLGVLRMPLLFAIPEVTGLCESATGEASVFDENGNAHVFSGACLVPAVVLLAPSLLEDAAREDIAAVGLEGICRAVEACLTPGTADAAARELAVLSLGTLLENLEPCWNNGGTSAQRIAFMEAARKAGVASTALGGGYIRCICRGLIRAGVDAGAAYGVMTPLVLEKYGNRATEWLSRIAHRSGIAEKGSQGEKAAALICRIRDTAFRLALPESIGPVEGADLDEIAWRAAGDTYSLPPVFWTEKQCRRVLAAAQ